MLDEYMPLTSIFGIAGTSYAVQLGKCKNQLVSVIYKGKEILASNIFKETTINDNINVNDITIWVLQTLYIPHINPYHVMQTNRALIMSLKRDLENKEQII